MIFRNRTQELKNVAVVMAASFLCITDRIIEEGNGTLWYDYT